MKQKFFYFKLLMLTIMAFFAGNVMADEAVFNFTTEEGLKAMGVAEADIPQATDGGLGSDTNGPFSIDGVTISTTDGSTPSRLWSTKGNASRDYRIYQNATMTITAPSGKNLSKITFTTGTWNAPSASVGDLSSKEWNGNANSLTLTMGAGQCQFKTITITYADASSIVTKLSADLSFSAEQVNVTLGETTFTAPTLTKATTAAVKYSSTNTSIATVDESTGAVTITATAAGTAKIKATTEENDQYYAGEAEYQIVVKEAAITVASILEMISLADKTEFVFNGTATVVYVNGKYVYIKDDTGSSLLFKDGLGLAKGDVIKAGWEGKVSIYKNLFEVVPSTTLEKDGTAEVTYPTVSSLDMTAANMNTVGILKGVSYTAPSGKNFSMTTGDQTIVGYNQFGLEIPAPEEGVKYDIEGVISVHNDAVQFQPISISAHVHDFIEIGSNPPTCTEPGSITKACECGETQTEETIPPLGHTWGDDGKCTRCGESKPATELEVPGTVIWSSDEAQTVDWNNGKSIVIPKENLADVKVGDVLNIGVLGAPEGASPSNWSYQIGLQDPSESGWKWIEANLPLNQGGDYVHSIAITGDMLKLMQADGVAINGTAFNVKKVAVESKYSGSDKSIWVGDETLTGWPPATIYPVHFEIANDFEGVKEGQIIRVNCTPAAGLALKYQGESTEWGIVDFPGLDLSSCATETGYDVPVTADMVSILKANRFLLFGDGTVKATSVELIDAPAAEPEVVSIFVFPDNGSDIYEAYAAEAKKVTDAGNIVGYVHIQLTENGNYTISNTIKSSGGIRIFGGFSTVDASALEGNMIEFATLEDPTEWVNTMVDIQHLNVKGLKKSLFCSNSKNYVVETFLIHDCMIEQAGDATTIDFTKGSTALNMIVQYSTFYAPTKTTKSFYSSQGGQKATDYDASALQKFTFQYNTMYNLAPTKNFFSHRQSNQKWMAYDIKNNIFVDCGKSGQVIRGFNGGQGGSNPTWTISGNLFNFEGADTSASESTGDDAEPVSDSVEGVITFTDPTAPDFSGSIELSPSAT